MGKQEEGFLVFTLIDKDFLLVLPRPFLLSFSTRVLIV